MDNDKTLNAAYKTKRKEQQQKQEQEEQEQERDDDDDGDDMVPDTLRHPTLITLTR